MDKPEQTPDMRQASESLPQDTHGGSLILHTLCRATDWLYTAIARSGVGRALTAYRHVDNALGTGRRNPCRSVSRGRIPVADAVKKSHVLALLRTFFRALYDLPLKFYGLFGLFYGTFGVLLYFLVPLLFPARVPADGYLVCAAVTMILTLPPLSSHSTLRESVSRSRCMSVFLGHFLCIPQESTPASHKKMPVGLPVFSVLLSLGVAIGALFTHPLLMPMVAVGLLLMGLIFSYPEAGVLLSTVLLPVAWLLPRAMIPLAGLILLTWCSYGFKLLRLHRAIRRDVLDTVLLVLLALTLISGVAGVIAGTGQVLPSLMLFSCLSLYFLVVHLMTTRAYIARCLIGVGVTVVIMTLALCLGRVEPTAMDWLGGSRAGDLLVGAFDRAYTTLRHAGGNARIWMAVLSLPLLYAALLRTRRPLSRVVVFLFTGLQIYLVLTEGSLGGILCLICATLFFFLFADHRIPAAGILLLPGAAGAIGWYLSWKGSVPVTLKNALSEARFVREARFSELWRMALESPMGYGIGADCAGGNLFLEVLVTLGFQGVIVFGLSLLLLLQKSLTGLRYATTFSDRTLLVGLGVGVGIALVRGATHGFLTAPHALLLFVLLCALCSAFSNILFEEYDVRMAESMSSPEGVDHIYRRR